MLAICQMYSDVPNRMSDFNGIPKQFIGELNQFMDFAEIQSAICKIKNKYEMR